MKHPLKYYSNNLCGTEKLLECMVKHGIDKIVFSSTAATYGETKQIPIMKTDRTKPTNCYGETKLSMEKMFHWTSVAHILAMKYLREGRESNIFNLGNSVGFTVKKVVETARKVTGHPIPMNIEPRRAGAPAKLIASSDKARKILGWNPKYQDLETIISTA